MNTTTSESGVSSNADWASEAARIAGIESALGQRRLDSSSLARCLAPLLVALNWFGSPRNLTNTLPDEQVPIGLDDFRILLAGQGYAVRSCKWAKWSKSNQGNGRLPVGTVVISGSVAKVYLGQVSGIDWWHDGKKVCKGTPPVVNDTVLLIEAAKDHSPIDLPQFEWLKKLLYSARGEITGVLFVSLVANLLALAISLFTMFVYNTVIPTGVVGSLWGITAGALLAIVSAWGLRLARVSLLASMSAWAGARISDVAIRKTLGLPFDVTSRLGVEQNLMRLRSIEGVRQWFGGAGGAVGFDYPFVLIFLIVIGILGGWIVVVPLVGLILFYIASWPLALFVESRSSRAGRASRMLGDQTTVLVHRLRGLRGVRSSALWDKRLRDLVAESAKANRDQAMASGLAQTVGQALAMLTVLATMGVGIALVLAQSMTTGGLIAAMMLIWRITTPAQQMFSNQTRLRQLADSSKQLDRLLESRGDGAHPGSTSHIADLQPSLTLDRLYYRYSADREPALGGVSFDVSAGQLVAVVGPNGAGKSTLLEVLVGLRQPQNGRLLVGGCDVRQFVPIDYRTWLGYMPQRLPSLSLTLQECLKLCRPTCTEVDMSSALARAAGPNWWTYFGADIGENALDVQIAPWREDRFALRARTITCLAGAILCNPRLIILDDPIGDRDPELDPYLVRILESLRGRTTVIMATHRPDLIQRADTLAVLRDGALAHYGPVVAPSSPDATPAS